MSRAKVFALALWIECLVGSALALGLDAAGYQEQISASPLAALIPFATVGVIIALRRPAVPLGWVFLAIGGLAGLLALSAAYLAWAATLRPTLSAPLDLAVVWLSGWLWYPLIGTMLTLPILLFPEGLPSRRWRPVLWVTLGLIGAVTATTALQPVLTYGKLHFANPIGIRAWHTDDVTQTPVFTGFGVALVILVLLGVASLVGRFRRSRGVERQQIKWFVLFAGLGAIVNVLTVIWSFGDSVAGDVMFVVFLAAVPISCGLAIFRYRLYDIDRIVSRTVSYLVVTGLLVGVYVGCISLMTDVLPFDGDIGTATSVLAAVALFAPLRRRVQRIVDHRFNRTRYDAEGTLAEFAARLREQVDLQAVHAGLLAVVGKTVQPASAVVWLRDSTEDRR